MADWQDPNEDTEEDLEYFSEVLADYEPTGKEPKFFKIEELELSAASLGEMRVDDLIASHVRLRDQLGTDRKSYKQREARVKLQMSVISMHLRNRGDLAGVDSFKTDKGTAYRKTSEKFKIQDWALTAAYVLKTGYIHMLQKRVSPNAVKEIRELEGLPPGIEVTTEIEFAVRAPTARAK